MEKKKKKKIKRVKVKLAYIPSRQLNRVLPNYETIDEGIREAVKILSENGFDTFESCEGGEGHSFDLPIVRFNGNIKNCKQAYTLCENAGLNILTCERVFRKTPIYASEKEYPSGYRWDTPFNQIVFVKHSLTGTIFLPN